MIFENCDITHKGKTVENDFLRLLLLSSAGVLYLIAMIVYFFTLVLMPLFMVIDLVLKFFNMKGIITYDN